METKEYTAIDRRSQEWPSGEWDGEPDKAQWPDAVTGMPCLAVRNSHFGFWCGYVGVAEGHPLFGKGYGDLDVEVHGGLSFADECEPSGDEASRICHVPGEGEPDHVWWFGFDCGHSGDNSPRDAYHAATQREPCFKAILAYGTYKTLAYVKSECADLARQLHAVATEPRS